MRAGSRYRTQAFSMLNQIETKIAPLSPEENNERIKRLAKKILRVVEVRGRRKRQSNDDGFKQGTLESELAI
ncbi:MAG: hypothetical protein NDI61_10535 [Bdellovibrionaceae bacterium]|nr:hypothetical protein [Pseudobdellovibrionaceae bacterium]